jgi:hypothetical protein
VLCLEGCTSSDAGLKATTFGGSPAVRLVRADFGAGAAGIANQLVLPNETFPSVIAEGTAFNLSSGVLMSWRDGSVANSGSVDATLAHLNGGVVTITNKLQLIPTSGVTCNSGAKGTLYVASGDGSLCYCNGSTWTPTPLTGTCD